MNKQDMILLYQ